MAGLGGPGQGAALPSMPWTPRSQDRPLTRPRTSSLACPGLLQWRHPYGTYVAIKMTALSSLSCAHTSNVLRVAWGMSF